MTRSRTPAQRLSREQWLEAALDVLAREGEGRIRVRQLAAALGVTTGSFYWHFTDRADFLTQIVRHWHEQYTGRIAEAASMRSGTPREQLEALALDVIRSDAARFDVPVRAWASHEEGVAKILRETDTLRIGAVGNIFESLGFSRSDATLRARVLVADLSMERAVAGRRSEAKRMIEVSKLLDLLCAPSPP